MKPAIKQNISAMRRFPINTGVVLTSHWSGGTPTHRVGSVVGYALNSLVEVVNRLHGDFQRTTERVIHSP